MTRGGTLELLFAAGINPVSQVGRTFKLFDWTGVSPTGAFGGKPVCMGLAKALHHRRGNAYRRRAIDLHVAGICGN